MSALTVEQIRQLRTVLHGLPLASRVYGALDALGKDVDEVADTLRTAQIRGQRVRAFGCPVAGWLCRATADGKPHPPGTFAVNAGTVLIYPAAGQVPSDAVTVPAPVSEFVRAFDGGDGGPGDRYADLVGPW